MEVDQLFYLSYCHLRSIEEPVVFSPNYASSTYFFTDIQGFSALLGDFLGIFLGLYDADNGGYLAFSHPKGAKLVNFPLFFSEWVHLKVLRT